MERYQNGKIYKIVCNITGKVYIGSTCKKLLSQRLAGHVSQFKEYNKGRKCNMTSFQILEGNDYYIELLENVCCNSKDELLIKERFYIQSIECVNKYKNLNMTEEDKKEWRKENYEKNKDKIKEIQKGYYENNKNNINEKMKEYSKEYYQKNKNKINEKMKEYSKEYREKNKNKINEKMKEYSKEYREKTKEYQKEYQKEYYLKKNF